LSLYVDAGFTPEAALCLSITIARYVVGFVLEEQAEKERSRSGEIGDAAARLAPFPLLTKVVRTSRGPSPRIG
jgi:TetR/AcrR family tetracycline transcriptional repressor